MKKLLKPKFKNIYMNSNKKYKFASAGVGAIGSKLRCVRKCVRNDFRGAAVRAPHAEISRNPTSDGDKHLCCE